MVLAEAMARGLPIVCTTGGAAADTVPDAAAIKVPPGDVQALGPAIRRMLDDAALRRRMSDASWAAGQKLPRWEDTARTIADVIKERGAMSGFDASWLDLREPADHRSRNEELAKMLTRHLGAPRPDLHRRPGLRHRLQPARHRAFARHRAALDAGRLRPAPARRGGRAPVGVGRPGRAQEQPAGAEQRRQAHHGAPAPRRPGTRSRARFYRKPDLVTASALFDLASADFISEVAAEVVRCRAAFYTVLTYNGQQRWTPKHDADAAMASAFRAHQTRDKGFGDAAGPMAPALLSAAFDAAGYSVSEGDSAWRLEAGDETLIAELVPGFAGRRARDRAGARNEDRGLAENPAHRRPGRPHRYARPACLTRLASRRLYHAVTCGKQQTVGGAVGCAAPDNAVNDPP